MKRIAIVGDPGVGKSTLLQRFLHPTDPIPFSYLPTLGVDIYESKIEIQFFDFAGVPEFLDDREKWMKKVNMVIVVFDLTSEASWKNVERYLSKPLPTILCANKLDAKSRAVPLHLLNQQFLLLQKKYPHLLYLFETSAVMNVNVERLFSFFNESEKKGDDFLLLKKEKNVSHFMPLTFVNRNSSPNLF